MGVRELINCASEARVANGDAFIDAEVRVAGHADGPLAGLTFAVKDIIDVAGTVTGCGNPTYQQLQQPSIRHAKVVSQLLDAGASVHGKAITDEFAFSLIGNNFHYGVPLNSRAPDSVCGGSSCGSASAVAAKTVDFALGTDTGGSVRVPASFCGLYGLRPTHGRISATGVMPLIDECDTVGFFSRNAQMMADIGAVLLRHHQPAFGTTPRLLLPREIWQQFDNAEAQIFADPLRWMAQRFGATDPVDFGEFLHPETVPACFDGLYECFGHAAWLNHRHLIEEHHPKMGPLTAQRFEFASGIGPQKFNAAILRAGRIRQMLVERMADNEILVFPTTPFAAPAADTSEDLMVALRGQILNISRMAPILGFPELSLPCGQQGGKPRGLSIMAKAGQDELLLSIATQLADLIDPMADR